MKSRGRRYSIFSEDFDAAFTDDLYPAFTGEKVNAAEDGEEDEAGDEVRAPGQGRYFSSAAVKENVENSKEEPPCRNMASSNGGGRLSPTLLATAPFLCLAMVVLIPFMMNGSMADKISFWGQFSLFKLILLFFVMTAVLGYVSGFFMRAKPGWMFITLLIALYCCIPLIAGLREDFSSFHTLVEFSLVPELPYFLRPVYLFFEGFIPLAIVAYLLLLIRERKSGRQYIFVSFLFCLGVAAFLGFSLLIEAGQPNVISFLMQRRAFSGSHLLVSKGASVSSGALAGNQTYEGNLESAENELKAVSAKLDQILVLLMSQRNQAGGGERGSGSLPAFPPSSGEVDTSGMGGMSGGLGPEVQELLSRYDALSASVEGEDPYKKIPAMIDRISKLVDLMDLYLTEQNGTVFSGEPSDNGLKLSGEAASNKDISPPDSRDVPRAGGTAIMRKEGGEDPLMGKLAVKSPEQGVHDNAVLQRMKLERIKNDLQELSSELEVIWKEISAPGVLPKKAVSG